MINSVHLDRLPKDGVFSVRVEIDRAPLFDTWFPASKLAATSTPEVASPTSANVVSDAHPVVQWKPFRSPEWAPFDRRRVGVYVSDTTTNNVAWYLWKEEAGELSRVRIGDHDGAKKTSLAPGSYWLALTGAESRSFGPITIDRRGQTGVPFNVVK